MELDAKQWFIDNLSYKSKSKVHFQNRNYSVDQFDKFVKDNFLYLSRKGLASLLNDENAAIFVEAIEYILEQHSNAVTESLDAYTTEKNRHLINRETILSKFQSDCLLIHLADPRTDSCSTMVYDLTTEDLCPSINAESLKRILGPKEYATCQMTGVAAERVFIPTFKSKKLDRSEDFKATFNMYTPPEWKLKTGHSSGVPEEWFRYLEHLFPLKQHRDCVLTWMLQGLEDVAAQHLILVGPQKTGKTLFAEKFLTSFHSKEYSQVAKENTLRSAFNSILYDATFVYFDEVRVTNQAQLDILKQWANSTISVELKHRNPIKIKRTFSMLFISNYYHTIYTDPVNNRKFLYPDISAKPLTLTFTEKDIEDLCKSFEDDQLKANFYQYLKENYSTAKKELRCLGKTYERMVIDTAPSILKRIVAKIQKNEFREFDYEIERDKLMSKNGSRNVGFVSVAQAYEFFNILTIDDKKVASMDIETGVVTIINKKYWPKNRQGDVEV